MPEIKRYKQYEILRRSDGTEWKLGSGAMGTTYKAFDTNLERTVALKIINDAYLGSEVARQQFLREARSAAGLRHPNIASVYDLGTDQDHYFYVMELIDGITVKEKVERDGPFSSRDALGLMLQIASALSAAERQRLVHRDLKPANLMLTEENGKQVVKIIDFGLAKKILPGDEVSGAFTIAGGFVGTAEYASAEQIREGDLDARSDIYSLGATLFFLLTGKPPFVGAAGEVMSHHLYKALPLEPLSNQPSVMVELFQRMMEKEREKRPPNASELPQLIANALDQHSAPARGEHYRLVEPKDETPQGQWFHALDERTGQAVAAFVFNCDLLSNPAFIATLKA
jgi:serine/threonine protein kinase